MKASDFNLRSEIDFDPEAGITSFRNTRLVLFDAIAIGLLRHELSTRLGWHEARAVFLRFGNQHGFADFLQMKLAYEFDNAGTSSGEARPRPSNRAPLVH